MSGVCIGTVLTVPDEFHGDKALLTFHEIIFFSLLAISAKVIIFNVMKLLMKPH